MAGAVLGVLSRMNFLRKNSVSSGADLADFLLAQIQQGKSYEAAYRDLAFAALNDGIAAGYVRGYLAHFGCGYEEAVWAAKTKDRIDFLAGDAFPTSTSPADTGQSLPFSSRTINRPIESTSCARPCRLVVSPGLPPTTVTSRPSVVSLLRQAMTTDPPATIDE